MGTAGAADRGRSAQSGMLPGDL